MSGGKKTGRSKTRWTREFKLRALSLMDEAEDVSALAAKLGCRRELLYIWRQKYRSGGAEALRSLGRRSRASELADAPQPSSAEVAAVSDRQRIAELERKIGQQQLDLDFFRAALRHVREQRRKSGGPGGEGSTR